MPHMVSPDLDDEELAAAQDTLAVVAAVSAFMPHVSGPTWVPTRKALLGDDERTAPFHMTHWIGSTIVNAFEHLDAFGRLMGYPDTIYLPRGPGYTLARGAIESAVSVWWVLAPDSRRERVARRMRVWESSRYYEAQAIRATGGKPDSTRAQRWDGFAATAAAYTGQQIGRAPGFTGLLGAYDRANPADARTEAVWRMASGFAHGFEWAGHMLNELTDLVKVGGGVNHAVSTARFAVIYLCLDAATVILLDALTRVDALGGHVSGLQRTFTGYLRQAVGIVKQTPAANGQVVVPVLQSTV